MLLRDRTGVMSPNSLSSDTYLCNPARLDMVLSSLMPLELFQVHIPVMFAIIFCVYRSAVDVLVASASGVDGDQWTEISS